MNEYDIYKYIEFIIFILYLVFIFFCIHIWLLWRDVDKNELKLENFVNESFFKKNCAYVFSFSILFMIHEFIEGTAIPNAMVYFEFFEMLAVLCLVLFAYHWYIVLKVSTHKKSLHHELTYFATTKN